MEKILEIFNQYARSELLILVPVLYIISKLLIASKVPNRKIPMIITILSIVLCGVYTCSTVPIYSVAHVLLALFTSVTQGILFAGASVLGKIIFDCECFISKSTQNEENESKK